MAKQGRSKLIETPEKLYGLFNDYKLWVTRNPVTIEDYVGKDAQLVTRNKPRPLSVAGFQVYCYNNASDVHHYFENTGGRYEDFRGICRVIKREVRQNQIDGGMAGIFNPSITQRLNGLTDKQEITTDAPTEMKVTIIKGNRKKP
jgi:hypothetical protein